VLSQCPFICRLDALVPAQAWKSCPTNLQAAGANAFDTSKLGKLGARRSGPGGRKGPRRTKDEEEKPKEKGTPEKPKVRMGLQACNVQQPLNFGFDLASGISSCNQPGNWNTAAVKSTSMPGDAELCRWGVGVQRKGACYQLHISR
jgi:hypothetical protein